MTIDQLQIFLAVVQHMHFTRAAEALYITQPSVSAAIQSLEEQYKVKLFHRIGRRIELTLAGKMLEVEAQKILDQVELTERGLRELNDLQRGELKLGASQTIANYWLPRFISLFKQEYPGIAVDCTLGNTTEISEGIVTGLFDLSLVEGKVEASVLACLEQQIIGRDCLQIVVGQSHLWFERLTVEVAELTTTNWVMREKGSGTRQQFEQVLRQWGIEPTQLNVILSMKSGEMVKAAVESGVGAAAISNLIIVKELRLDMLRRIQITGVVRNTTDADPLSRPFWLLKHRERFQTRISQAFEQLLVSAKSVE
ncbi:LysR family transcriptional regulator [Hassallia byssoidea VB512170]|uniref:LysR family transcriptional regulator n=1 Tax=Hassallia byssoidea VB512170 TaxID=1304833 RepID=A0A846HQ74_9CYAN|nr:LysR family transcriptional regulator [Hassalia byssoidea]NEU77421.1 LysR family transcriptional regulator [Hassalia byssoidea VB512170]